MKSKLTLLLSERIIADSKLYARNHGKSLSKIVEEYLKSLTSTSSDKENGALTDLVKELKGSVKTPKNFKSYKETLEDALVEKYK